MFKFAQYILVLLNLLLVIINASDEYNDKDYVSILIKNCNYPVEIHKNILTKDGYLLTMQRIPSSSATIIKENTKIEESQGKNIPVLLMHGVAGSAENFFCLDCQKSLALMLSEQGYDVWLGNIRSVSYSRHHKTLNPDDSEFWQFTLDELANYDLTALIDYILDETNQKQLMYVGHSQGNLLMYMLMSNQPEYADKIKLFVNLSPIFTFKNHPHPWLKDVARNYQQLQAWTNERGLYEWTFGRDFIRKYGSFMCAGIFSVFCKTAIYFISGMSPYIIHDEDLHRMLINCPEGISSKVFYHACQVINSEIFRKYDFGSPELNLQHYGTEIPPEYNISLTSCPTALYYAKNDWFLNSESVKEEQKQLPNVVDSYLIPIENFSHADFTLGWDAPSILYPRIIALMNRINN